MRISDWSSDVCSSDLYLDRDYRVVARSAFWHETDEIGLETTLLNGRRARSLQRSAINRQACWRPGMTPESNGQLDPEGPHPITPGAQDPRSKERRVGKECGSTFRHRWSAAHQK